MTLRLAADIGGTFTDLVALDDEAMTVTVTKAPTTPAELSDGVLNAIAGAGVSLHEVHEVVHGTTIVINALTERRGARTGLVTTKGFRDVLEIGRGNRPDMYNLVSHKPVPFVPRRHRFEVTERVDRHGKVLVDLDLEGIQPIADVCRRDRIEALAVCLLHSYAYPAHEQQVGEALRAALPSVPVTLSSEITREWREYERSSTAVLNAYVQPQVERYLETLERRLRQAGLRGPIRVVQSSGGTRSAAAARATPITLVESGPAAGVIGAARLGERLGEPNMLYLDIGGTTAKCSLIEDGKPKTTTGYKVEWRPDYAGYPVLAPVIDVVEIGAGGGSIAWLDDGGSVCVGPRSAGADPGPACYGRGGTAPTVTDAKLTSGVLDPDYFLGGRVRLHRRRASEALAKLGRQVGLDSPALANGIIRLVNANMIGALKLVSVRRGYDPRDFVLVAAGGGGPMHAAALGAVLQVKNVLIPPYSGVFSAWGMGTSEARHDVAQTRVLALTRDSSTEIADVLASLERDVTSQLVADGADARSLRLERSADMRYRGQEHTVRVPVARDAVSLDAIQTDFHTLHRQNFTFDLKGDPVEIVTWHVAGFGLRPSIVLPSIPRRSSPTPKGRRRVDFDTDGVHEAMVYERMTLPVGSQLEGPLVVEDATSTVLVHPGQTLEVDDAANLVVWLG